MFYKKAHCPERAKGCTIKGNSTDGQISSRVEPGICSYSVLYRVLEMNLKKKQSTYQKKINWESVYSYTKAPSIQALSQSITIYLNSTAYLLSLTLSLEIHEPLILLLKKKSK